MTETTDDLVKRAREVLEGVSDGPWVAMQAVSECWYADGSRSITPIDYGYIPAITNWRQQKGTVFGECQIRGHKNVCFIAAARTLVPAMADRIEELEAELAAAQDQLRKLGETI